MFTITSGPHISKINWNFDFCSWGGLGINFRVRIQFGQVLSRFNLWIRETPIVGCCCCCCCCAGWRADCPLAAWGEPLLSACTGASLNQSSNPLTHLSSSLTLCGCPKGLEGLWEEEACSWSSMHGRPTGLSSRAPCLCLCLCQLPELPLPL